MAHPDFGSVDCACIRTVSSFHDLATTPFAGGINSLCWPRVLPGDFREVVALLGAGKGMMELEDERLRALPVSAGRRAAVEVMLEDLRRLRDLDLEPVLNAIHDGYRDGRGGPVATDVYSWHVDSAPVEADTWLCTYHGPTSEGLSNEDALRRVDVPETRAELLRLYGGADDAGFLDYLNENAYDLHYVPRPGSRPYSFGVGNLWRVATQWPGSPVPPCIHRAPENGPGEVRLLLIS